MVDKVNESNVWPVNSDGEILAVGGQGPKNKTGGGDLPSIMIPKDEQDRVVINAPGIACGEFTTATRPAANSVQPGTEIILTDFGRRRQYSDGAQWLDVSAPGGGGATLADGNYVDVTVSNSGTTITINDGAVQLDDIANVSSGVVLARTTAGAGVVETPTFAQLKTAMSFVKADVGLANVDNTSDANKPISNATQTALDGKSAVGHTHTSAGITDFAEAVDDRVATLLTAGTNVTLNYNDVAGTLTINATGGGGSGDVTKVGTPANNQVGVWTGDGTLEGDSALTFDTTTDTLAIGASGKLAFGAVDVLSDAAGTTTLQNIDAIDATTETTLEAALELDALQGNLGVSHLNSGTAASASTFWRGDGTWATPAGGGNVSNSGTPTAGQVAEWTSATVVQGVAVTGTGSYVKATSPTLVTPVLGTPSSGTLTNCTGLPVSTGVSGLGTGVATFLATPSSANLAAAITGETGSGALVFGTSPTISGLSTTGVTTNSGTEVTTVSVRTVTANAATVDVAVKLNRVTHNANLTLSFSGSSADDQWFGAHVINSNATTPIVVTIPSSYSVGRQATVTSFVLQASGEAYLLWLDGGSVYRLFGETPALNNFAATADPTANDDSADGYAVGSLWGRSDTGAAWWCESAAAGAAVWNSFGGGGSGNVTKVGTPADNQVGVWTGDGTIEGDSSLTFDTATDTLTVGASGNFAFGAVVILDDNAGTTTLQNIDAIDATTETTLEAALELDSLQGNLGVAHLNSGTGASASTFWRGDGTWATPAGGGNVSNSGTPTAGQAAEWTSATVVQGVAVTGTGSYVKATSPTLVTPALGTPASGTLTNCTGLPISTGVSGLGTGVATFLATPSSANLASAVTGETGTGALVFGTGPSLSGAISQLDALPGTNNTYQGTVIVGRNAGGTIAQWDAVYLDSTGVWQLADANGTNTFPCRGLAVAAYTNGNAATVIDDGVVRNDTWAWTIGGDVYLSTTAGGLTQTAPTTSGDKIQKIGYALSADSIRVNIGSGEYVTAT